MTTLYRSVVIESAEQAEALPIGTPVVHHPRHGMEDQAGIRVRGGWEFTGTNPDTFGHQEAVGMEALVPIEATEESMRSPSTPLGDAIRRVAGREPITLRRLVTPWEEE
jgi:hypothetical protein